MMMIVRSSCAFRRPRSSPSSCATIASYTTWYRRKIESEEDKLLQKTTSGIFLMRNEFPSKSSRSFLLLKLPTRFDLPKGNKEPDETELQTALRELFEETGIDQRHLDLDDSFRFERFLEVTKKAGARRYHAHRVMKRIVMHLAYLRPSWSGEIVLSAEHGGSEWRLWNPPHASIEPKFVDPVIAAVEQHVTRVQNLGPITKSS